MSLFKCPKNVHIRKRWIKATLMESWESQPFFQDFAWLFYHSNLAGWLITHFSVVWQTHNILNLDFTGTLNRNSVCAGWDCLPTEQPPTSQMQMHKTGDTSKTASSFWYCTSLPILSDIGENEASLPSHTHMHCCWASGQPCASISCVQKKQSKLKIPNLASSMSQSSYLFPHTYSKRGPKHKHASQHTMNREHNWLQCSACWGSC